MASTSLRRADTVLALPITGESFLFRRDGRVALVDGGWARDNVASALVRHVPDTKRLDVVVCTHGDADHSGGLPGLLDKWAEQVGQVWLPGRWVDVVPQLVKDPKAFLKSLIQELDSELREPSDDTRQIINETDKQEDATRPESDPPSLSVDESLSEHDWLTGEGFDAEVLDRPPDEPEWFTNLREHADQIAGDVIAKSISARRRILSRRRRVAGELQKKIAHYWLQLIDTAKAIRGIAVAAIEHSIPTRWFDFEEFARTRVPRGGARDFLVPLNAVEQYRAPVGGLFYMHLTQINRESLVFLAPPMSHRFGVLFCADSPLGDGANYANSFLRGHVCWPMVVTAPHHGSEANRAAYSHLSSWTHTAVLLRSGGNAGQPGPTFLKQSHCLRLCAKCPRQGRAPLLTGVVGFTQWLMLARGRCCDCN
jgi:hypothetical protein